MKYSQTDKNNQVPMSSKKIVMKNRINLKKYTNKLTLFNKLPPSHFLLLEINFQQTTKSIQYNYELKKYFHLNSLIF